MLALPTSGGTRMQEGTTAFLQMVAIAAAVIDHKAAKLPYLVYLRHPTTGGVYASWGSLGHLTIAEPGALIGFLGPRVYEALYDRRSPRACSRPKTFTNMGSSTRCANPASSPASWPGRWTSSSSRRARRASRRHPGPQRATCLPGSRCWRRGIRSGRVSGNCSPARRSFRCTARARARSTRADGGTCPFRGHVVRAARPGSSGSGTGTHRTGGAAPGSPRHAIGVGAGPAAGLHHRYARWRIVKGGRRRRHRTGNRQLHRGHDHAGRADGVGVARTGYGRRRAGPLPRGSHTAAAHGWLSPLPPEGASAILHHTTQQAADMAARQGVRAATFSPSVRSTASSANIRTPEANPRSSAPG